MKTFLKIVIPVLLVAALAVGVIFLTQLEEKQEQIPETEPAAQNVVTTESGVQTMLVMSLVEYPVPDGGTTLRNDRQADFILLMTIDADAGKTTAVQLDPASEVQFAPQGASEAVSIPVGQVYSYGSGGSDSNLNILTAVSRRLDNAKIDHYMTFDADSLALMADMLGGVTVEADAAFAAGHPELVKDGSVCLDAQTAEVYFNFIGADDPDNTAHMRRQQNFIRGFFELFSGKSGQEDFVTELSLKVGEKMDTDLTLSQMLKMMETLQAYELDDAIQILK